MLVGLAQPEIVVGDVAGNAERIAAAARRLADAGAEVVLTPELSILGYPPRDLLLRTGTLAACLRGLDMVATASPVPVLVGTPRATGGAAAGAPDGLRGRRNAVALCGGGEVRFVCDKRLLPGYDVFDEDRWFDPGEGPAVASIAGRRVGVLICEDLWQAADVTGPGARYGGDPLADLVAAGATSILSLSASPFVRGKHDRHRTILAAASARSGVPIASVNAVGAHDDLVFDGRSMVVAGGCVACTLAAFEADECVVDLEDAAASADAATAFERAPWAGPTVGSGFEAETLAALARGVRDYVERTGHRGVRLGLSGGIDSAVVAAIAVRALGPARVRGVLLPSRYSSAGSIDDARDLADRLGLAEPVRIGIEPAHAVVRDLLEDELGSARDGVTDENVQARLRGLLLMATSNATGDLLLSTSNKSELAVGYSTLYGDMCGGLAPIGDLWKGEVYALARWMNEHPDEAGFPQAPIPPASIGKPPSAELRPDQRDTDTLPDYEVLDAILARIVDHDEDAATAARVTGHDFATCMRLAAMLDRVEHKRYQATIVLKANPRTFGRGRSWPVVMRWAPVPAGEAAPKAVADAPGPRSGSAPLRG